MKEEKFAALTGMRFIAATLVFVFHYAQILYQNHSLDFGYYLLRQLNVGVNIFFVLSGFLIAYRYYSHLQSRTELLHYWWKRIARILPLYYAVLGIHWIWQSLQQQALPDTQTFLLNITLLKGMSASYFYSVLTQSWSLTAEGMFYLLAPFSFFLIRQRKLFLLQIPLLIGFGLFMAWLQHGSNGGVGFGDIVFVMSSTFFGRCFEFFVGIYLAFLVRKGAKAKHSICYTTAGAVAFFLLLFGLAYFAYQGKIRVVNDHAIGILLFNFLMPGAIGLFLYGLLTERTLLSQLLSKKTIMLLGESSYAFYLLHIGLVAEALYFHVTPNVFLLFVLLSVLSVFVYKWFERPMYQYLTRMRHFDQKAVQKIPQPAPYSS